MDPMSAGSHAFREASARPSRDHFIPTRFVGHDADQVILPACKDAGVPFVPVQTGYGVAGVRCAIARLVRVGRGATR